MRAEVKGRIVPGERSASSDTMNSLTHSPEAEAGTSSLSRGFAAGAVVFQPLDSKPWGKAEWNSLITSISQHNVIPVIGPELLTMDVNGRRVPLYQHVAERLAERLELPVPSAGAAALYEVVCRYKRLGHAPSNLLPDLCEIMVQLKPQPPPALRHLAEIRGFKLFVSTTPDRLLDEAISAVRFRGRNIVTSLEYSLNLAEDLPQTDEELKSLGNLSPPVVFHPFGKFSVTPNSCVLTEEDLLEFFYHFQKAEQRLPKLLAALRDRQLLFLGATWSDWFARFFLRNAHRDRFTKKDQMDYVVGDCVAAEETLISFLQDFANTTRLPARDPAAFVSALRDRWLERYPPGPPEPIPLPAKIGQSSLFISYAREDAREIEQLRAGLEEAGLEVWFDRQGLTTGADWDQKITENIRTCLFFLPVISQNTEAAVSDRFFREEWTQAAERARRSDESYEFILPIKLDDRPYQKVPRKFCEKNWTLLPGGKVTPEFIAQIKALVEQRTAERDGH
jgi:TIR domain/SIR2-like domain